MIQMYDMHANVSAGVLVRTQKRVRIGEELVSHSQTFTLVHSSFHWPRIVCFAPQCKVNLHMIIDQRVSNELCIVQIQYLVDSDWSSLSQF